MNRIAGSVLAAVAIAALALGAWVGLNIRGQDNPWLAPARDLAEGNGWEAGRIDAGLFQLTAFRRLEGDEDGLLVVYIEGDGYAWKSPTELSSDPTPRRPRVLELAVQDPEGNVAYLARPCQYLPDNEIGRCPPVLWSVSRYAGEVIDALDIAIDSLKREAGAARVRLVGVSGGGTLAALVAARRDDVVGLVTVAANLDHGVWTDRHAITPLIDSRNAADVALMIQDIPQVHFIGAQDGNVTRAEVDAYVARMDDAAMTQVVVVPEYDHTCCWASEWPRLLDAYPVGN
jgi:pimeloyl-ACP methyl ester carboxylesterase